MEQIKLLCGKMNVPEGYILISIVEMDKLLMRIAELESRLLGLESRTKKDSSNSHKPPSSDGLRKVVKNNRTISDRKPGAQEGHKGTTLEMVEVADKIIVEKLYGFCTCGADLESMELKNTVRKQLFELCDKLTEVIEYRIEVKQCCCGKIHQAASELKGNTQYGNKIKSLMVYFNQYQMIPFDRLQQLSKDILGLSISDGFLSKSNTDCYDNLEQTENQIKAALTNSLVINNDETGIRSEGKTRWIHSTSTDVLTHYSLQNKRGNIGIDAIGILPQYQGISIHDRWASYDHYTSCTHGYCNAHLLRDLKYLHEELHCQWAADMINLLTQANKLKLNGQLNTYIIEEIEEKYIQLLQQGYKDEPLCKSRDKPKRGKIPKSKSRRLLDVFAFKSEKVLLFLYNPKVPFDNNLAERDLRMIKLKQKISGCFRTQNAANIFCRIRGYISSARKQGHGILYAIQAALNQCPIALTNAEQ